MSINRIKIFQVDAFTDYLFGGNPAAVCPLEFWLTDELMQNIAMENNLAETCFFVPKGDQYEIRWFTPTVEVDLCGHATSAAAHVLFDHYNVSDESITFHSSRSGILNVTRNNELITLNFPTDGYNAIELDSSLTDGFNLKPIGALRGKTDFVLIYKSEGEITNLRPDLLAIAKLKGRGVIVTAPGDSVDFVSRFFAPQSGIDEDPVTGSAHTTLIPYWAKLLKKDKLSAVQLSKRKGFLTCEYIGDRVLIGGKAKTYLTGEIELSL